MVTNPATIFKITRTMAKLFVTPVPMTLTCGPVRASLDGKK